MKKSLRITMALLVLSFYNHLIAQTNVVAGTQPTNKSATTQKPARSKTERELIKIGPELIDAVLQTDEKVYKQVYDRYLADNFIYVGSRGNVGTKKDALNFDPPKPSGHFTERLENIQVHEYGDNAAVVVLTNRSSVVENGQIVVKLWSTTDTYLKQNGQWKLVANHSALLPNRNKAVKIASSMYDAYAGQYQMNDDFLTISRNGDKLMGQTTSQSGKKDDFEFLPTSETHFYIKDQLDEVTFVKDDQGKVSYILHRHSNGQEVKEMKVK